MKLEGIARQSRVWAHREIWAHEAPDIPYGCCQCGCGERPKLSDRTCRTFKWVEGEPRKYVYGHQCRVKHPRSLGLEFESVDWGYASACWALKHKPGVLGYVYVHVNGVQKLGHRYFYESKYGRLSPEQLLHHKCENKACVNPDHVEVMTRSSHMTWHGANVPRGEDSPCAKLSNQAVREIRAMYERGGITQTAIGRLYGVSGSHVCGIVKGKTRVRDDND